MMLDHEAIGRIKALLRVVDNHEFEIQKPPRVFPIDEVLTSGNHWNRHKPQVLERIRRLNAKGYIEGSIIRGWHPHARTHDACMDYCGTKKFNAKWGKGAHRRLRRDQYHRDGKRMQIPGITYIQGPSCLT